MLNRLDDTFDAMEAEIYSPNNKEKLQKLIKEGKQYLKELRMKLEDVEKNANKWKMFMNLIEGE